MRCLFLWQKKVQQWPSEVFQTLLNPLNLQFVLTCAQTRCWGKVQSYVQKVSLLGSIPGRGPDIITTCDAGCSFLHRALVGQRRKQPVWMTIPSVHCVQRAHQVQLQSMLITLARHCVNVTDQRANPGAIGNLRVLQLS